jgi:hypothetical protein
VVVLTAVDSDRRPYVLVAPRTSSSFNYSFDDADLDRSVPLTESETAALVSALEKALQVWDQKTRGETGRFVELMHAPEQDINRVSQNVVEWHSALRLTISHTPDGPRGRLVVGDSPKTELQHVVSLKKRERVADLRAVLQEARSQMQAAAR